MKKLISLLALVAFLASTQSQIFAMTPAKPEPAKEQEKEEADEREKEEETEKEAGCGSSCSK
jgi:ribosomal protein L12E/L44/L45/RPP1/RPP2